MRAMLCDRCGAIIRGAPTYGQIGFVEVAAVETDAIANRQDLCARCTSEYRAWWEKPRREGS